MSDSRHTTKQGGKRGKEKVGVALKFGVKTSITPGGQKNQPCIFSVLFFFSSMRTFYYIMIVNSHRLCVRKRESEREKESINVWLRGKARLCEWLGGWVNAYRLCKREKVKQREKDCVCEKERESQIVCV